MGVAAPPDAGSSHGRRYGPPGAGADVMMPISDPRKWTNTWLLDR